MVHLPFLRLGRAVGGRTSPDISGWRERCGPRTCLGRISAPPKPINKLPLRLRELLHPVKEKLVRPILSVQYGKDPRRGITARNSLTLREVPFSFRLEPDA